MGKEIYHQAITNHTNNLQTKIDGRNWASGIYFVRLSDEKGNFVSKKIAK
jgi:hypothetical protein